MACRDKRPGVARSSIQGPSSQMWCENATTLTGEQWRYVKVPQKEYMKLQPVEFYDLLTFVS